MGYPFTDDHDMIREAARGFLTDWYDGGKGPERIYQSGLAYDTNAWVGFARDLGMAGVSIPEKFGGAGLGDLGRVVVMEELGASLCAVPFLTTCGIAADLLDAVGTAEAKDKYLPKIASGTITATYHDGHDSIKKHVRHVVDAGSVDIILSSRWSGDAVEIIAISSDAPGLEITSLKTMDPTRNFGDVDWRNVDDTDIDVIGQTTLCTLNEIITTSFVGLAAECLGGAQKCLDLTLEYTAQRVQFDRTIASFQAVKHRCADMFVGLEAARSAVYAAAIAAPEVKAEAALIAKAYATDAYFKIAGDAIQMHGGIGFTWEYPLHFFFKRARANRAMFGKSSCDYDRLADSILGVTS